VVEDSMPRSFSRTICAPPARIACAARVTISRHSRGAFVIAAPSKGANRNPTSTALSNSSLPELAKRATPARGKKRPLPDPHLPHLPVGPAASNSCSPVPLELGGVSIPIRSSSTAGRSQCMCGRRASRRRTHPRD
jgi:hypothetical protein